MIEINFLGNFTKKPTAVLLLTTTLCVSLFSPAFADVKEEQKKMILDLNKRFEQTLHSVTMEEVSVINSLDSLMGGKINYSVSHETLSKPKDQLDLLMGVYAVFPFYTSLAVGKTSSEYKVNLNNKSSYSYEAMVLEAKKILDTIVKEGMTDIQKIEAINKKIIEMTSYSLDGNVEFHSSSGPLFLGTGVCDGYSRLFMIMAKLENIPALQVTSSVMNHGFNLVRINGEWKILDITYNDTTNNEKKYFLLDPNKAKDHKFDNSENGLSLKDYTEIGNLIYS